MNTVIYGAGALGGYFGALLAAAGEDVSFVARGDTLWALRTNGLVVEGPEIDTIHILPVIAADDPAALGIADAVILCAKTYDLEAAAAKLTPLLHDETGVICVQNGVEAAELVRPYMTKGHLLPGTLVGSIERPAPGKCLQPARAPTLNFGGEDVAGQAVAERIAANFTKAGLGITLLDDTEQAVWRKFLFFVANSTVACLLRMPIGDWRDDPGARGLFVRALEETVAVGNAKGITFAANAIDDSLASLDRMPPGNTPSTLRDMRQGRPLEIPHVIGALSRLGNETGVPTPFADFATAVLMPHASGSRD